MEYTTGHEISPFYQVPHQLALKLVEGLTDEQVAWKANADTPSIGFHLWHLARWTDDLQAIIADRLPQVGVSPNLWETEGYAARWNLDPAQLGEQQTGQLLEGDAANILLPDKDAILDYARRALAAADAVAEQVDVLFMQLQDGQDMDETTRKRIINARRAIIDFMGHDNRHLGMMEGLKGVLTGKGTATV
ncbi:MAG: DinB family protein [Anaerolineales bacterium]|nr:DinB family protein [Anaerolineales bacterium]